MEGKRKKKKEKSIYPKGLASPLWGWQAARNQGRSWGYRAEVEFHPHQDALSSAPAALHLTESGPVDDLKRSPFLKLMTHFNPIYKISSQRLLGQRFLNTWGPSPTQTDTHNRASHCGVTGLGHLMTGKYYIGKIWLSADLRLKSSASRILFISMTTNWLAEWQTSKYELGFQPINEMVVFYDTLEWVSTRRLHVKQHTKTVDLLLIVLISTQF